jgi:hypothetical protein
MNKALPAFCALCAQPVADADALLLNGKKTCAACRDAVLAIESAEGKFTRPLGTGLAAAAGCGALWAALTVMTERELGFAAVGVGWAAAYAMRRASGGRRGPRLQKAAVGCTLLGLLLGKFFLVAYALRELAANAPGRPPNVLVFFARVFPRMLTIGDALWLILALSVAWLVLKPVRIVPIRAAENAAPSA